MKKLLSSIAGGCISLLIMLSGCGQDQWTPLFNGEDLDNWSVKCLPVDRDKEYWTVKDGAIECNSMGDPDHHYVWLMSDTEYRDFHLKLKFQLFTSSQGNSGVQFRSRYDDSDTARNGGWLNGPQVDIHGPNPMRTGLVYDETEGVQRWIYPSLPDWRVERHQVPPSALLTGLHYYEDDPGAWNNLHVVCKGMQVTTIVNGNVVADFDGGGILDDRLHQDRKVGTRGFIALQLHRNDELLIRFKDIYIRKL